MSLLDDLRSAAQALDIQFQPASNEIQGIVAALVHYAEHGNAFLEAAAAGAEDVAKLLNPTPEEPVAQPAPPTPAPEPAAPASDAELEAQISDLQAQLDSRRATSQQTQVVHETGAAADAPAAEPHRGILHPFGGAN